MLLGRLFCLRARRAAQQKGKQVKLSLEHMSWQDSIWEVGKEYAEAYVSHLKDAERALTRAIQFDHQVSKAWNMFGQVLGELGKFSHAISAHETAIKLDPICKEYWFSKGLTEVHMNDFEAAELSFQRVLDLDKNDVNAWWCLGATIQDLGRESELAEVYVNLERLGSSSWTVDDINV